MARSILAITIASLLVGAATARTQSLPTADAASTEAATTVTAATATAATVTAATESAATEATATPATIQALLDAAADRFSIPRAVLYGVSYNESRWNTAQDTAPSCTGMPRAWGIMGLHDDEYFGRSIAAGEPIGISAAEARASADANILAGAYHLATLFDGADRTDPAQWAGAIGRYSGIPASQPALQLLYADGVFELLRRGWSAGAVTVAPIDAPRLNREKLERDLRTLGIHALGSPDYPDAVWSPSPNYSSRGGAAITHITIHDTEGNFAGSLSWLVSTQSQASAHYMVRSVDGYIVQMVREQEKAWHVRTENPYTIGIEHEGYVAKPEFFTPALYRSSADLVRTLLGRYNIPLARERVKGHLDYTNNTHTDPGGWWDWPGYFRLIERQPALRVVLDPFEDNVVGWWQPSKSGSTNGVDTAATRFEITPAAAAHGSNGGALAYTFTSRSGTARVFRSGHGNTNDGLLNVGADGRVTLAVNGDAGGNELSLWFYDRAKNNIMLGVGPVTWRGWRTVSVPVPALGAAGPYRFHSIVLERTPNGAASGLIGVDDLAHETGTLGTSASERPAREHVARRIALAPGASLRDVFGEGAFTIHTMLGQCVARGESLPAAPAASYLPAGLYVVRGVEGRGVEGRGVEGMAVVLVGH